MAAVTNPVSGEIVYLTPHHTFGRRRDSVDTFLDASEISNIHAVIEWNGVNWTIKDLSRNGTWVDGVKLEKLKPVPLNTGSAVQFASMEAHAWRVRELSCPAPLLVPGDSSGDPLHLASYNILPDDSQPEMILFQDTTDKQWYWQHVNVDLAEERYKILHGQSLVVSQRRWIAILPVVNMPTNELAHTQTALHQYDIQFHVSSDEENVALILTGNDQTMNIGYKTNNYLLLHLARQRIIDARSKRVEDEQGWIKVQILVTELGLDETYINLQVFRIRKHFSEIISHIQGHEKFIERRRGQIRIGVSASRIQITEGVHQGSPTYLSQ